MGRTRHPDFAMASGEITTEQFASFLTAAFSNLSTFSQDGSIHFICMDWRHMGEVTAAAKGIYSEQKNLCVWNKTNAGMGAFYRSKHEMVFVFKVGAAPHTNTFGLGDGGRYRTNVWDYAGVNTMKKGRMDENPKYDPASTAFLGLSLAGPCFRIGLERERSARWAI